MTLRGERIVPWKLENELLLLYPLNFLILDMWQCTFERFWKNVPARFLLDSGKLATLYPGEAPSRPCWAHGLGIGLSAGGLLGASCQKQRGGEGVFYWHSQLARTWVFSVKLAWCWLCLWVFYSVVWPCLRLLCWHGTLLEWPMPRACVIGQSPSQGGGQRTSGGWDCLWVNAGMFLRIPLDTYISYGVNYLLNLSAQHFQGDW